ncbi:MAG: 3,4-dihydroxy-2-butanone-4-phosphate synthase [Pelagibacteraceae bacterium TMED201]|nr:MAG: 3,4-dihydroxy-2-butanone-4-phosphate synthase [Pelagibacteraceae bacterium TMED201]
MLKSNYSSIETIIKIAKKGEMFILVDDEKRENEGDLVISTSDTNSKNINFMAKYGRGLICLALDSLQAKRLNLSLMSPINQSRNKTAFAISIEAKKGITTGISAKDRAKTIKVASKKNVNKNEIVSPGHVFPIIAKDGGVLVRAGHTEASVDISKLAKKNNSAVICEIMNEDGTMAKGQDLFNFAKKHKLKIGKIEDLIAYKLKKEKLIRLKKQSFIDVKNQKYKIKIYENILDGSEHFALIKGNIKRGIIPRVRVISSNVVQNYLINQKLPNSFNKTLKYFKKHQNCVLVFIKDTNLKSVTQTLKDYKYREFYKKGNDKLIRNYGIGAQIIKDLKIKNMILITKSLKKVIGLDGYGIKIKKQELI